MSEIRTYKEFISNKKSLDSIREFGRKFALSALSLKHNINKSNNWIKLPYYHHVFEDEKLNFERQLKYLKNFGDFISMNQVCELISNENSIDGRYFSLSFDDGFLNCRNNMMEITNNLNIPVIIYLPTDYVGLNASYANDIEKIKQFYPEDPKLISFLSWEDCKEMLLHNITFGSHTCSHANLSKLHSTGIETELRNSKTIIEEKLNTSCLHFACPWGRIGIDFHPEITTDIAKRIGFKSFATTNRGKMQKNDNLYQLRRDHLLAEWGNYQLKYFFGK